MAAFFVGLGTASPGIGQSGQTSGATAAERRLLGSDDAEARLHALLPFTRSLGAGGTVRGSLADSAAAAGVPHAAMLEALQALDDATGGATGGATGEAAGGRMPQDGDAFYVRWQQAYTVEGDPIGVGLVQWLELRTESGATIALHRFRPREGGEQFFLADGGAATPPAVALPIEDITVSSHFGFRTDPLSAPASARGRGAMGPLPTPHTRRETAAIVAAALARAHAGSGKRAGAGPAAARRFAGFGPRLFMHEGVDFAVPPGTPIHAASDGVVTDARRNGGYGNYIRIEHADGIATAYGHLSRFAPGLKPGRKVVRGELVGFSGNTGRSTGPHLHFEVLADGKPVDPLAHAAIAQLAGPDLEQFGRQVAARERVRDSESAAAAGGGD